MLLRKGSAGVVVAMLATQAHAARIVPDGEGTMLVPVTPFANMASGYQATNPGFKAILRDRDGRVIASGPLTMDSVIDGYNDDATRGSAYGRLVLSVTLTKLDLQRETRGEQSGSLSICMEAGDDSDRCSSLGGNIHPERPFQWIDKDVSWSVNGDTIKIEHYSGWTGEGGTPYQVALAVYHPAFAFAAPGKAFKDFQSPLVLDLNDDGRIGLTDVWNDKEPVLFDLAGDGQALRTGWVDPQDGILALDVDGNGVIDSGRELFGEHTKLACCGVSEPFLNGFLALAKLDTDNDGKITAKDQRFADLRVWQDFNHDGVSQKDELSSLAQKNITTLSLGFAPTAAADHALTVFDNEVRLSGSYTKATGEHHLMADVWFKQRRWAGMSDEQKREAQVARPAVPQGDYGVRVSNRRKVDAVNSLAEAGVYAQAGEYVVNQLKAGMEVMFSASYGVGGEAGQARGVLVERDGGLYYKQLDNPTSQLLLPPGLRFNGDSAVSKWEMRSYIELVNKTALAFGYATGVAPKPQYASIAASLVDFDGGTAGRTVKYKDALELVLARAGSVREPFQSASSYGFYFVVRAGENEQQFPARQFRKRPRHQPLRLPRRAVLREDPIGRKPDLARRYEVLRNQDRHGAVFDLVLEVGADPRKRRGRAVRKGQGTARVSIAKANDVFEKRRARGRERGLDGVIAIGLGDRLRCSGLVKIRNGEFGPSRGFGAFDRGALPGAQATREVEKQMQRFIIGRALVAAVRARGPPKTLRGKPQTRYAQRFAQVVGQPGGRHRQGRDAARLKPHAADEPLRERDFHQRRFDRLFGERVQLRAGFRDAR